jgi:DNA-binding NarL/FixJ family response regulator
LAKRGYELARQLRAVKPITVLIVDDIPETREHLRNLLDGLLEFQIAGFAENGLEAIEKYDTLIPDVMTTCIHMPKMDGLSAIAEIRRRHPDAKVILLTVDDRTKYRRRAVELGVNAFLVKPPWSEYAESIREVATGAIPLSALVWDFQSLKKYHTGSGMNMDGLIQTMDMLNEIIGDEIREITIAEFLHQDLRPRIESIWHSLEPELDRLDAELHKQGRLQNFYWNNVKQKILQ